ncbi:hypothetical protein MNBD_PLANCTO02-2774, partial [hydrothermal vent metagenome]
TTTFAKNATFSKTNLDFLPDQNKSATKKPDFTTPQRLHPLRREDLVLVELSFHSIYKDVRRVENTHDIDYRPLIAYMYTT